MFAYLFTLEKNTCSTYPKANPSLLLTTEAKRRTPHYGCFESSSNTLLILQNQCNLSYKKLPLHSYESSPRLFCGKALTTAAQSSSLIYIDI